MNIFYNDGVMYAYLTGEIDHHCCGELRSEIDSSVRNYMPEKLIMDFGNVKFCDSSGIALVSGRSRLMKNIGGKLELTSLHNPVEKIFKMANIEKIATIK